MLDLSLNEIEQIYGGGKCECSNALSPRSNAFKIPSTDYLECRQICCVNWELYCYDCKGEEDDIFSYCV